MYKFPLYHWHLEISSKCALKCPRCPRTNLPGKYRVGELPLEEIKRIFSQPEFAQSASKVTLCGGQGDPIYHSKFLEVVAYLKSFARPKILTIITNGSGKSPEFWRELKSLLQPGDDITFSVDGFDQASNEKYRVNSRYDSVINGIREMVNGNAMVFWNAIYFRFNQNHVQVMEEMARDLGVDAFRWTRSELFGSKYAGFIDPQLGFDPLEPDASLVAEHQRMFKSMTWFREDRKKLLDHPYKIFHSERKDFTQAVLNAQFAHDAFPNCLFGFRGVYVDVDAIFYPCSWVSHPMHEVPSNAYQASFSKQPFDLKQKSIKQILASAEWKQLHDTWSNPEKDLFLECSMKCTREKFPNETLNKYLGVKQV